MSSMQGWQFFLYTQCIYDYETFLVKNNDTPFPPIRSFGSRTPLVCNKRDKDDRKHDGMDHSMFTENCRS